MSNKIDQEMDAMAENMEKSVQDPADQLFKTIEELGPEVLKSKMADMNDDEKELLKAALEEMNLQKSGTAEFDKEATGASYFPGKVYKDTVIQEDRADDEADEKLVKPEGAKQFHQGSPNGEWKGQAIQDPTDSDNDDNQMEDTSANMKKSICEEFVGIDEILTDDMLDTVVKSFGNDFDMIEDYFNADDDFADQLLEKGARTKTQNGIRVYAEGKNAGRPVGSIRGDKASVKAIARARKKGKISAKGAREGIKDVNATKKYVNSRKKAGLEGRGNGKSDKEITANAAKKVADKNVGIRSKQYKDASDKQAKKTQANYKEAKEAREKVERKKDGSYKQTKANLKRIAEKDQKKKEADSRQFQSEKEFNEKHRKPTIEAGKKKTKELKAKRDKMRKEAEKRTAMKKSQEFEMETNLLKAMASDETMTEMMYKMMFERGMEKSICMDLMLEKGMDKERCGRLADKAVKKHEKKMHKAEPEVAKDASETADEALASVKKSEDMEKGKMKEKMIEEENQLSDTDKAVEGTPRKEGKKSEDDKLGEDNKSAQKNVDKMDQGKMAKSIEWGSRNDILKSGRGGQNHRFSVNEYYDNALAKSETPAEDMKKSEKVEKEDINDIIQKSEDQSWEEVQKASILEKSDASRSGRLVTSFSDNEIAAALGLTEEEAKKILG